MARLGSFAAPVDLPEQLRPWSAWGLEMLFLPGPAAPAHEAAEPSAAFDSPALSPLPGLPLPAWPEPWASLAARAKTAPRVVFTYAALAADLGGAADPARRKLFQAILAHLGWPKGACLFWPVCSAQALAAGIHSPEAQAQAQKHFRAGIWHFDVAHVACFGAEVQAVASALFPRDEARPLVTVHSLPGPEALVLLLPHELHRAVAGLKALSFA